MEEVVLVQFEKSRSIFLENPKIDGPNINTLRDKMKIKKDDKTIFHIFSNAFKILPYTVNPNLKSDSNQCSKILCLGKVQSGKTAFFISTIALAFDNGYSLVYVIGGTKNKLRDQNYIRLTDEFSNNSNVVIIDITKEDHKDPVDYLQKGFKVILVILKNTNVKTESNLDKVNYLADKLGSYPSIIIDDEGDESSVGAPKLKKKNPKAGRIHDVIIELISKIRICTFLSVTATPQANFLISTLDEISPDYAILVEPGKGYTGGNAFHDNYYNPHVIEIKDSESFDFAIPNSFKKALYFFLYSILTLRKRGKKEPFSMLVHPSSLSIIHSMVSEKIKDFYQTISNILLNKNDLCYDEIIEFIYNEGKTSTDDYGNFEEFKKYFDENINFILNEIAIYRFNSKNNSKADILSEEIDKKLYKIYVGGNMLGRGLTITNLNVTYIYRDSKITQIDTLYQRARWFGYKSEYFDLCRVYMTSELKKKFVAAVENENDMWNSLSAFLMSKTNIKIFPRIFSLKNDKLRLTRTSVSKTIVFERVNPGYSFDKSIYLKKEELQYNRNLYNNFYLENIKIGKEVKFGNSEFQHHFVINMKYTTFYNSFLSKYIFPKGSTYGPYSFANILTKVNTGEIEDNIFVILMRYKTGQFRSAISNNTAIRELPQGYDNNTEYPGDKELTYFKQFFHIQLHPVYIDKEKKDEIIPLIAMNNPITEYSVRLVTGDNYYEEE